jgi:hypothetical protein
VDGAALYVRKDGRQVIQGLVEPLPAVVDMFALGNVVGQVLQDDGGSLPVFLGYGAGKGVDLVNCHLDSFRSVRSFSLRDHRRRPMLRLVAWESTSCQPRAEVALPNFEFTRVRRPGRL